MVFGRKRRRFDRSAREKGIAPEVETHHAQEAADTDGPYDVLDAPDDGKERIDLGALRVPVIAGVELKFQVDKSGRLQACTLVHGTSAMQLGVFAAPRSDGIWDEVRKEMRTELAKSSANRAVESEGPFGPQLLAHVAVEGGRRATRFVGVDGPRWFFRAAITGDAATDAEAAAVLEEAFRNSVVVRGVEPKPVKESIPLTLPKELQDRIQAQQDAAKAAGESGPKSPTQGAGD